MLVLMDYVSVREYQQCILNVLLSRHESLILHTDGVQGDSAAIKERTEHQSETYLDVLTTR